MTNPEREMRRKARSPFYRRIARGGSGTRSLETKPEMASEKSNQNIKITEVMR